MGGEFKTKLQVESDGQYWKLLSPLVFESDKYGEIIVPVNFLTDFASVPRIPLIYAIFGNTSHSAATLHDYLYSGLQDISRKDADAVFLEAMESRKQSKWHRKVMWKAVRWFGKDNYNVQMVH